MTEIREVELPGVGVRHEFVTEDGNRVGVVSHRSGRREVYLADSDDSDRFRRALRLSEEDARTLAEILGPSRVAAELAALQQKVEGLAIDWLPVREDSPLRGARSLPLGSGRAPGFPSWPSSEATRPSRPRVRRWTWNRATTSWWWGRPGGSNRSSSSFDPDNWRWNQPAF
jgi:hypothetical protein